MMLHIMKSAGQFGRETSQIIADTETDGDFTPAWEKKWLFNIKRQQITLKPAGQTQKGVMDLGKQPDFQSEVLRETVKFKKGTAPLHIKFQRHLHNNDLICLFWEIRFNKNNKRQEGRIPKKLCKFNTQI